MGKFYFCWSLQRKYLFNTQIILQRTYVRQFMNKQDGREFQALSEYICTFVKIYFCNNNNSKISQK